MGFSGHESWGGLPCPLPGDLPDPGTEPRSSSLQADSLLFEPPRMILISLHHDLSGNIILLKVVPCPLLYFTSIMESQHFVLTAFRHFRYDFTFPTCNVSVNLPPMDLQNTLSIITDGWHFFLLKPSGALEGFPGMEDFLSPISCRQDFSHNLPWVPRDGF